MSAPYLPVPRDMDDLNPSLWSGLSEDVLCVIIENSDVQSQVTWSCTNHRFYEFASTLLWTELSIKRDTPQVKPPSKRCRFIANIKRQGQGVIGSLASTTHDFPLIRGRPALLPLQRVRRVCVNLTCMGINDYTILPNQVLLKYIDSVLLRLPSLVSFSFDGPFRAKTLRNLVKIRNLELLELRTLDAYSGRGEYYNYANRIYLPWKEMDIDFSCIAKLKKLRILKIGHLVNGEARRLAQGLRRLNLTGLEVSASSWTEGGRDRYLPTVGKETPSPIANLVDALESGDTEADLHVGSFPTTLRSLLLRDLYHYYELSEWETLWASTQACRDLSDIKLDLMNGQVVKR